MGAAICLRIGTGESRGPQEKVTGKGIVTTARRSCTARRARLHAVIGINALGDATSSHDVATHA